MEGEEEEEEEEEKEKEEGGVSFAYGITDESMQKKSLMTIDDDWALGGHLKPGATGAICGRHRIQVRLP